MKASLRPPRPAAPAAVHTLRFLRDPFSLLEDARRECGEIFRLRLLGLGEWVFVCSPALVREVFKAPRDVLVAGETNRAQLGFMLGLDATFTLDGDAHRRRQRLVHPHLNGRRVLRHAGSMRELAERALAGFPVGRPFAFLPHAHRLSLQVMVEALFGDSSPARRAELAELFERYSQRGLRSPWMMLPRLQVDLGPWSPWGRILGLRRDVSRAFADEIDERLERLGNGEVEDDADVVTQLAAATDADGRRLSPEALLDEVVNLLFAGHETTGNVLAWTMETLHAHPDELAAVREEIAEATGGGPVGAEHVGRLERLRAAVHETFRTRPLAPMAGVRLVKAPYEIGGHRLEPGMIVTQAFPVMAQREELFESPERFCPAHFHGRRFKPFEWNPFGGGTRMCIGRGLAEVELQVVLATLLRGGRFRIAQERVRPERQGIFFSPSRGLRMVLEERLRDPGEDRR